MVMPTWCACRAACSWAQVLDFPLLVKDEGQELHDTLGVRPPVLAPCAQLPTPVGKGGCAVVLLCRLAVLADALTESEFHCRNQE